MICAFLLSKNIYYNCSDNGFKCTFVNRALSSLHGGSFEIMLTVPLIDLNWVRIDLLNSCSLISNGSVEKVFK